VLFGIILGLLAGMGVTFWYRWDIDSGRQPPAPVSIISMAMAAGFAIYGVARGVQAVRRPCRKPFRWSREWLIGFTVIGCLIGFGGVGMFADDYDHVVSGIGFFVGVMALSLLASWKTKPICGDSEERWH
jgi:hypothetical protein